MPNPNLESLTDLELQNLAVEALDKLPLRDRISAVLNAFADSELDDLVSAIENEREPDVDEETDEEEAGSEDEGETEE